MNDTQERSALGRFGATAGMCTSSPSSVSLTQLCGAHSTLKTTRNSAPLASSACNAVRGFANGRFIASWRHATLASAMANAKICCALGTVSAVWKRTALSTAMGNAERGPSHCTLMAVFDRATPASTVRHAERCRSARRSGAIYELASLQYEIIVC